MSTLILLRHAHSQANEMNILSGRAPGIDLSQLGHTQAKKLITRLGGGAIDKLYLSPMQRCQSTIDPWLRSSNSSSLLSLEVDERFNEMDFGDWSGFKLSTLSKRDLWPLIQSRPSTVKFPKGESFKAAQRRAIEGCEEILEKRGRLRHLVVTHSDLIKLIAVHYMGSHLDTFQRINIDQASLTVIERVKGNISIKCINNRGLLSEIVPMR